MKKIIGVLPLWDEGKNSLWMLPGYTAALEKCGALPIILPLSTDSEMLDRMVEVCSGFLFTGGQDIAPEFYGEARKTECGEICTKLDSMEKYIMLACTRSDIPVLGICRGVQFMNVCFGGSLYQDIPSEMPECAEHHMSAPFDRVCHSVKVYGGTPLAGIMGAGVTGVNSYHHQGIKSVAPSLKVCASAEDGLTEALYMPYKKYFIGVQWHPELNYYCDDKSMALFSSFVDSCE